MCLFKADNYYAINFLSWKLRYICTFTKQVVSSLGILLSRMLYLHIFAFYAMIQNMLEIFEFSHAHKEKSFHLHT